VDKQRNVFTIYAPLLGCITLFGCITEEKGSTYASFSIYRSAQIIQYKELTQSSHVRCGLALKYVTSESIGIAYIVRQVYTKLDVSSQDSIFSSENQ
jgi:hypothetical protein